MVRGLDAESKLVGGAEVTILEARIRRRLCGTRNVQVFRGGDMVFGSDDDVVKLRRKRNGVRVWSLWSQRWNDVEAYLEVLEWWYPVIDELRVMR